MHLARLELENLRAFPAATIDLPATGIVLLVGANNSGKSALLSAVDVVARIVQFEAVRHAAATEPARVHATFALSEGERREVFELTGRADEWLVTEAFALVRWTFTQSPDSDEMYVSSLEISQADRAMTRIAEVGYRPTDGNFHWRSATLQGQLRDAGPDVALAFSAEQIGGVRGHIEGTTQAAPLTHFLGSWRQTYYHFRALRIGTDRRRNLSSAPNLDPRGVNLPEALLHLNTNAMPAWNEIRAVMSDVLPDVGELHTPTSGTEVAVEFRDPHLGVSRNIKDLGTGVEQLLMTAYVGVTQPTGSVILIEEPETNLHPGAQRQLLHHLRQWAGDKLFLLSTHSSVFLDFGAQDLPVWLVERREGRSSVRRVEREALSDALQALGVRPSDFLSADRVLVVEGEPDAAIVRTWFGDELQQAAVVPGRRGGDLAWQMESLDDLLEAANRLETRLLFLRDRDELSDEAADRLAATAVVHVLRRREIENYLLDAEAIHHVLAERAGEAGVELPAIHSTQHVAERMRAIADETRSIVVLKRVAFNIKPLRLITRAEVRALSEAGGSKEALLGQVQEKLPPGDLLDEIAAAWDREEQQVDEQWEERWLELAPGADVLERLFAEVGLTYNKLRDGQRLASASPAPEELRDAITEFLA